MNAATIAIPVTEATPAQIDREINRVSWELAKVNARIDGAITATEREANRTRPNQAQLDNLSRIVAEATIEGGRLESALRPLESEFDRRPWTRYFLITDGHLHYDVSHQRCSRVGTSQHFLIDTLSGLTADEAIEIAGERVCTTCFPQAPVSTLNRPSVLLTRTEAERAEARQEREEAAKAKAADKDSKAITSHDGEPLLDTIGWKITTEAAAQKTYREITTDLAYWTDAAEFAKDCPVGYDLGEWNANRLRVVAERLPIAERALLALAAKHGISREDEIERHAKPLAAKIRREAKERAGYRAQR